jgi:1-acyl-sn-glycerol-3-phosphate acyltransferase
MLYVIFRAVFRVIFSTLFRWQVIGRENIPNAGPVVLVSNHIDILDPPLLGSALDRKVSFMAKEQLFRIPVLSFFIREFGAFPVKRGAADKQSIRKALTILKDGGMLGIFPEGTRSKTGKLGKGMPGAALFALRTDSTVIPVAIIGPYRWFGGLKVVYGSPMDMSVFKAESSSDALPKATEQIMSSIQNLIDLHR